MGKILKDKSQPYITKYYFGLQNPPVKLAKIAMGNGVLANFYVYGFLPVVCVLPSFVLVDWTNHRSDLAHHDRNIPADDRV